MKVAASTSAAPVAPLATDLVVETSELSGALEPRPGPASAAAAAPVGNGTVTVAKPALQNFKVVKVTNAAGETVEETIQKYVSNATAHNSGQQIIILKYQEPDEAKVKAEEPIAGGELQQADDALWMEVPVGAEINVNQEEQQTIIVEEMPMYFTEGSQVVEYHIASDSKAEAEPAAGAGASTKRRHLVLDSGVTPGKRQKKDALLATSSPYHKCGDCGEEFVAKYKLLAHRKIHDGKQPYTCSQCGEVFPVKNMLANHLMQHSGELTCTFCARVLSTKRSLQRHIAQHTGEKEYKCTECDKDFFDRIQLVEHMRTHTGEKPFACQVCGTAFARNSNLLAHMRIHRDEKPYHCEYCGREFRWRNNMVLHQKKHLDGSDGDSLAEPVTGADRHELEPVAFNDESNGTEASN